MAKKILVLFFGLAVAIAINEAALRLAYILFSPSRSHQAQDPAADLSIVCVGDSVTYGYGAADPNDSYPGTLEKLLTSKLGKKVSVDNQGAPGTAISQQLEVFKRAVKSRHYDIAILMTGCNFWKVRASPEQTSNPYIKGLVELDSSLRSLKTYTLIKTAFIKFFLPADPDAQPYKPSHSSPAYDECIDSISAIKAGENGKTDAAGLESLKKGMERCAAICPDCDREYYIAIRAFSRAGIRNIPPSFEQIFARWKKDACGAASTVDEIKNTVKKTEISQLNEFIAICNAAGIKLVVMDYPSIGKEAWFQKLLYDMASANGFLYIGLSEYFRGALGCDKCREYFIDQVHLNSKGYRKMAEMIADRITAK